MEYTDNEKAFLRSRTDELKERGLSNDEIKDRVMVDFKSRFPEWLVRMDEKHMKENGTSNDRLIAITTAAGMRPILNASGRMVGVERTA